VINQFSPGYNGPDDEYIELLNKTNKSFDLSALKIDYESPAGMEETPEDPLRAYSVLINTGYCPQIHQSQPARPILS
jgi:hypothetical protein